MNLVPRYINLVRRQVFNNEFILFYIIYTSYLLVEFRRPYFSLDYTENFKNPFLFLIASIVYF